MSLFHAFCWALAGVGFIVYVAGKKDKPQVFIPGALCTIVGIVGNMIP
ncbi:MAG: hypothetical protein PHY34_04620 [Patescibacteria group bacterium]|nr:hypothetical protein [Patescibacteria group bacterium]